MPPWINELPLWIKQLQLDQLDWARTVPCGTKKLPVQIQALKRGHDETELNQGPFKQLCIMMKGISQVEVEGCFKDSVG